MLWWIEENSLLIRLGKLFVIFWVERWKFFGRSCVILFIVMWFVNLLDLVLFMLLFIVKIKLVEVMEDLLIFFK